MKKRKWQVYLLLVLCAAVTVCPFIWMILTSFKSYEESIQIPPTILPKIFTVESYQEIVAKFPFLSFYINTFLVLIFTIVIELLICSMATARRRPARRGEYRYRNTRGRYWPGQTAAPCRRWKQP